MTTRYQLFNTDCSAFLEKYSTQWATIFADPPDNIGLKYDGYNDTLTASDYVSKLHEWLHLFVKRSRCLWFSHNAKWTFQVGTIVTNLENQLGSLITAKPCIQTFTFGQCQQHDLPNCHRPLLRIKRADAPLYPDAIRVPSWRQEHGDKRADPRGRVPGDVFDFPRVTGNSKQRRAWHKTQLHEGLVERCLLLTTQPGECVLDPFAGTGTTLRVCKKIGRDCTLIELSREYCEKIAEEHELTETSDGVWSNA